MLKKLKSLFIVEEEGSISSSQTTKPVQNQENMQEKVSPVSTPNEPMVPVVTQSGRNCRSKVHRYIDEGH